MLDERRRVAMEMYVRVSQEGYAKLMNGHLVEVATLAEAEAALRNPNEWKNGRPRTMSM